MKRLFLMVALIALSSSLLFAQPRLDGSVVIPSVESQEATFRVRRLVSGLEHPWSIAFISADVFLVSERPGRLQLVRPSGITAVSGLPSIATRGQGGLLDILVDPQFDENGRIYFTYTAREGLGHGTRLMRARLEDGELTEKTELFRMRQGGSGGRHFGSRIVLGEDGQIYMTIGDRGSRERAQDPGDHAGKTLRITTSGRAPADNPLIRRMDALPEVFTLGNRNAQGMTVHPETGEIWQHEHGPRGGDEVNIIRPGRNYGWPVVTFGDEYRGGDIGEEPPVSGYEDPLLYWTPSIAPSGMAFYFDEAIPGWKGDLFVGALVGRHLRRVELRGEAVVTEEVLLQGALGRIRDVRLGPDGRLHLLTDDRNGGVYRIEPLR